MADDLCCKFCSRQGESGVWVFGVYMCGGCQEELLDTPVAGERYLYFLKVLKEAKESWVPPREGEG